MSQREVSISVVVPVYNEVELLEDSVQQIQGYLQGAFRDFEVILVESGSTDGSGELCDEAARRHAEIRVVHEGARRGFGSALKLGFSLAQKEVVTMAVLDFPYPLESIGPAADLIGEYDAVLSYRSADLRESRFRKVQSWVFNNAFRAAFGLKARHLNSALKVYRRETIQSLPLVSDNWFIDTEIVYWLTHRGVEFAEVPVQFQERRAGRSSTGLTTPFRVVQEAIVFSRKRRRAERSGPSA
jgi:glycosyltransferase involved in cell wall biosynthesis